MYACKHTRIHTQNKHILAMIRLYAGIRDIIKCPTIDIKTNRRTIVAMWSRRSSVQIFQLFQLRILAKSDIV